MQIGGHHYGRAQVDRRRKMGVVCEVIGHEPNSHLTLPIRLLVNGSSDRPLLKIGSHFGEKVRCYQFYFSSQALCHERAADRKTVNRFQLNAAKLRKTQQYTQEMLQRF